MNTEVFSIKPTALSLTSFNRASSARFHPKELRFFLEPRIPVEGQLPGLNFARCNIGAVHAQSIFFSSWYDTRLRANLSFGERVFTLTMLNFLGGAPKPSDENINSAANSLFRQQPKAEVKARSNTDQKVLGLMELILQSGPISHSGPSKFKDLLGELSRSPEVGDCLLGLATDRVELEKFLFQNCVISPAQSDWLRNVAVKTIHLMLAVELVKCGFIESDWDKAAIFAWDLTVAAPKLNGIDPKLVSNFYGQCFTNSNFSQALENLFEQVRLAQEKLDRYSLQLVRLVPYCQPSQDAALEMRGILLKFGEQVHTLSDSDIAAFFKTTAALGLQPEMMSYDLALRITDRLLPSSKMTKTLGAIWLSTTWRRVPESDRGTVVKNILLNEQGKLDLNIVANIVQFAGDIQHYRFGSVLEVVCWAICNTKEGGFYGLNKLSSRQIYTLASVFKSHQRIPIQLFREIVMTFSERINDSRDSWLAKELQNKDLEEAAGFIKVLGSVSYLEGLNKANLPVDDLVVAKKEVQSLAIEIAKKGWRMSPRSHLAFGAGLSMLSEVAGRGWFSAAREALMERVRGDIYSEEALYRLNSFHGFSQEKSASEVTQEPPWRLVGAQLEVHNHVKALAARLMVLGLPSFSVSTEMIETFPCPTVVTFNASKGERKLSLDVANPWHYKIVGIDSRIFCGATQFRDRVIKSPKCSVKRISYWTWQDKRYTAPYAHLTAMLALSEEQRKVAVIMDSEVKSGRRSPEPNQGQRPPKV